MFPRLIRLQLELELIINFYSELYQETKSFFEKLKRGRNRKVIFLLYNIQRQFVHLFSTLF